MTIDLNKFSTYELSEIWSVLNSWGWHELLGDKPEGFDDMPESNYRKEFEGVITKQDIIHPINHEIESMIGLKECLRGWNTITLGKTNEEFEEFWENKALPRIS